jgi:hypothetical protein
MIIQLKKGKDGPPTLACVRADGSRTWARVHPFFPAHDLTHCAVESVLGFGQAFFGLVAAGWEIDDFARPGAARRLSPEAVRAERIVGLLDLERASGRVYDVAEFDAAAPGEPPLTTTQLVAIRALRDELHGRWLALAPGETLDLPFPVMPLTSAV